MSITVIIKCDICGEEFGVLYPEDGRVTLPDGWYSLTDSRDRQLWICSEDCIIQAVRPPTAGATPVGYVLDMNGTELHVGDIVLAWENPTTKPITIDITKGIPAVLEITGMMCDPVRVSAQCIHEGSASVSIFRHRKHETFTFKGTEGLLLYKKASLKP